MWENPPAKLVLSNNEVHLWRAGLDLSISELERLRPILSPDEKERADRFYFEKDRVRFTAARAILRTILGRYLGQEPAQVCFSYGPQGKPFLAGESGERAIRFNISHSGGLALYTVTRGREVGVDLEKLRSDIDCEGIADRYFTPAESRSIQEASPELKSEVFLSLWVCKEAYIKGRGEGLSIPLNQFEVKGRVQNFELRTFVPAPGFVAALAVQGRDVPIFYLSFI
jgi:4'-phosphopantetheinyl transferase